MIRVEFSLSMPSHRSWSGNNKRYLKRRNLTDKYAAKLGLDKQKQKSWYHHFGDGWSACVNARVMNAGERGEKSAGFCGYDWMVDNIIWYGQTERPQTEKLQEVTK